MEALNVIATLLASLTALYVAVLQPRLRRPSLSLLSARADTAAVTILNRPETGTQAWLRIRVENRRSRRVAEDVQVLVVSAAVYEAGWRSLELLAGRSLKWSEYATNLIAIPPGMARRIDLLEIAVTHSGSDTPRGRPTLRLPIYPQPQTDRNVLGTIDTLGLVVAICSKDAPAIFYRINLTIDLSWSGDRTDTLPASVSDFNRIRRL